MAKLVLLPEDPRRQRPDDPGYCERCDAWQRERDELVLSIDDTEAFDITDGDVRSRLLALCEVLPFYHGNVRPADEAGFRRTWRCHHDMAFH